jgi:hypothetical protein
VATLGCCRVARKDGRRSETSRLPSITASATHAGEHGLSFGGMEARSWLWTIAVVLLVLWLLGFFVAQVGDLVHVLLVLAVIAVLYNVFIGRGGGSRV